MFNLSTKEVVSSIENSPLLQLDGIYYQEYFNFFGNSGHLIDLGGSNFGKLEHQEHLNRISLSRSDPEMKKVQVFFMNTKITNALAAKFNIDLRFDSVDYWVDGIGYTCAPHRDNKRIKLHIQVYLSDGNQGTCLYDGTKKVLHTFQYKKNYGYALLNNEASLHGVPTINKDGRKSLYVRYS